MGTFSLGHWLVVIVVVLIMFGAGRLPKAMGDLARGLRAFRSGLQDERAASATTQPKAPAADPADGGMAARRRPAAPDTPTLRSSVRGR